MKSPGVSYFTVISTFSLILLALGCGDDTPVDSGTEKEITTGTVTDIDSSTYNTVRIGDQWWMAENLKVTHYRNGDEIQNITSAISWATPYVKAYCNYGNDEVNVATYGRLYNWYAVHDTRNIAPVGWHVPTDAEWDILIDYLGRESVAGGKLKESGTSHWSSPNSGATNESGFSALPGGRRSAIGDYSSINGSATFWSSSYLDVSLAHSRSMSSESSSVLRGGSWKNDGMSVRCIKDSI